MSKKTALIAGVTTLLKTVLNKDLRHTMVVIDEVPANNWGMAGEQVSVLRQRLK